MEDQLKNHLSFLLEHHPASCNWGKNSQIKNKKRVFDRSPKQCVSLHSFIILVILSQPCFIDGRLHFLQKKKTPRYCKTLILLLPCAIITLRFLCGAGVKTQTHKHNLRGGTALKHKQTNEIFGTHTVFFAWLSASALHFYSGKVLAMLPINLGFTKFEGLTVIKLALTQKTKNKKKKKKTYSVTLKINIQSKVVWTSSLYAWQKA